MKKKLKKFCSCETYSDIRSINLKNNAMKTFKIFYQDAQGNELWMSVTEKYDLDDATKYANLILATSNVNDVESFEITEA